MAQQRNRKKFKTYNKDSGHYGHAPDLTAQLLQPASGQQDDSFDYNPFAGISIEDRTFLQKCADTFFVFLGNDKKLGLVPASLGTGPFILLALSPLLLFLFPLLLLMAEKGSKHPVEKSRADQRSLFTWILASIWAIPGIVGGIAAIIAAVAAIIALGIAAIALTLALVVAAGVILLPGAPLIFILYTYVNNQKNYSLAAWITASILAIPSIVAVVGVIIAVIAAALALVIAYGAVAAAFTIACLPIIAVVHAIWGPSHPLGFTSTRRSIFLNPLTYVMAALLAVGISLLIQGVNPSVFISAAAPMMIAQTLLMSMAALAVLGGMLYAGYRIGLAISSKKGPGSEEVVGNSELQKKGQKVKAEVDQNYITKYLSEHWKWMKANYIKASFFYGVMFVGVGSVTLLVANHLTAGLLFGAGTENLMKVVFDFMVTGFASGLQSMAGLPGLEFLAASDATLLVIGQVFTVFTLIAGAIVIPYTGARLFQTVQEDYPSAADKAPGYQTLGKELEGLDAYEPIFRSGSSKNAPQKDKFVSARNMQTGGDAPQSTTGYTGK